MRAVVLGVGNILLSDEGIGVHAVNALAAHYDIPAEVEIIDGGTSAMDCLDRIAEADFLLIADCVRGGREPGDARATRGRRIAGIFPNEDFAASGRAVRRPCHARLSWPLTSARSADRSGAEILCAGP